MSGQNQAADIEEITALRAKLQQLEADFQIANRERYQAKLDLAEERAMTRVFREHVGELVEWAQIVCEIGKDLKPSGFTCAIEQLRDALPRTS